MEQNGPSRGRAGYAKDRPLFLETGVKSVCGEEGQGPCHREKGGPRARTG